MKMKSGTGSIMLLFILMMLCINIVIATYNVTYDCPEVCVEGRQIDWRVNITHLGTNYLYLTLLELRDAYTNETFLNLFDAEPVVDPSVIGSNKSLELKLAIGQGRIFEGSSIIGPANTEDGSFKYYLCMGRRVPMHVFGMIDATTDFCYKDFEPIQILDCVNNDDCNVEEFCDQNECMLLNCDWCQYPYEHICLDYDCCESSQCGLEEACVNNTCMPLECNETEFLANHICSEVPCLEGEIIVNSTCVNMECAEDEFRSDYFCLTLNCSPEETYVNHTCVGLNCSESEGIINRKCVLRDVCKSNEDIIDNECKKLKCGIFKKGVGHECLVNTALMVEIVLFLVIALLVVVDYKKYHGHYRKRLVDTLLKKARQRDLSLDKKSPDKKPDKPSDKKPDKPSDKKPDKPSDK